MMMKINNKTYKVWKILLEHPDEWLNMGEVAYETNLTCRQVSSIITTMPSPPVYRERDPRSKELVIKFSGGAEDANNIFKEVTSSCYGLTEEMFAAVKDALSESGWMCISDISKMTGITRLSVARILELSDGVIENSSGSMMLYRKVD